jgi:hypothetical protein
MSLLERTGAPQAETPWLPMLACLFVSTLTAITVCPEPVVGSSAAPVAALRSTLSVCLVGVATAIVTRVSLTAFFPAVGEHIAVVTLEWVGMTVWLVPLSVLVSQELSSSILAAALLGLVVARQFRRSADRFRQEGQLEPLPDDAQVFASLEPPNSLFQLLPTFGAVVAIEASLIAHVLRQTAAAAILAGAGCFVIFASVSSVVQRASEFQPGKARRYFAIQLLLAMALTTIGLLHTPRPSETLARFSRKGAAPSFHGGFSDRNLHSGIILTTLFAHKVRLVAPPPPGGAAVSLQAAVSPTNIEFSGEYWIFPNSLMRPPQSSMIESGNPLNYTFTCVDHTPLVMQARQRLPSPIKTNCCSSMEVVLRNSDRQPEAIEVRPSLASFGLLGRRYQALGAQKLPRRELAILSFPIPTSAAVPEFNEIVVEFDLGSPRMYRSANVSVVRFVLVPRFR